MLKYSTSSNNKKYEHKKKYPSHNVLFNFVIKHDITKLILKIPSMSFKLNHIKIVLI